jgi:hypothetical protein
VAGQTQTESAQAVFEVVSVLSTANTVDTAVMVQRPAAPGAGNAAEANGAMPADNGEMIGAAAAQIRFAQSFRQEI